MVFSLEPRWPMSRSVKNDCNSGANALMAASRDGLRVGLRPVASAPARLSGTSYSDVGITGIRAIHLSRLHWCDAVPRLAGWCPVPAFARRVPVMVRHGRGLLGLSGVAALAGRVRLPTM